MVYKVVQFNVKRTAECLKECFLCYSVSIAVYEECWIHLGNGIDDSDKVYLSIPEAMYAVSEILASDLLFDVEDWRTVTSLPIITVALVASLNCCLGAL